MKQSYDQMLSLRMADIHEKILWQKEEYRKLSLDCEVHFQSIVELSLHDWTLAELKAALIEYSDIMTSLRSLAESTMYEQGIKDGYALQQLLVSSDTNECEERRNSP